MFMNNLAFQLRWSPKFRRIKSNKIREIDSQANAFIEVEQVSSDYKFVYGTTDDKKLVGKSSAMAAFYKFCRAEGYDNAVVFLETRPEEYWFCAVLNDEIHLSSDQMLSLGDIEEEIETLDLSVSEDTSDIKVFASESICSEAFFAEWATSTHLNLEETDFTSLCSNLANYSDGKLKAIKHSNPIFLLGAVGVMVAIGAFYFIAADKDPKQSNQLKVYQQKLKEKQRQEELRKEREKNKEKAIENAVKEELAWMAKRLDYISTSHSILDAALDIFKNIPVHFKAWDAKRLTFTAPGLSDDEPLLLKLVYQRADLGSITEFKKSINKGDFSIYMDSKGNIGVAAKEILLNKNNNNDGVMQNFNLAGEKYFSKLDKLNQFCRVWSTVNCSISDKQQASRFNKLSIPIGNIGVQLDSSSLLLPYDVVEFSLSGESLTTLTELSRHFINFTDGVLVKQLDIDIETHKWQLVLAVHQPIKINFAKLAIENIRSNL